MKKSVLKAYAKLAIRMGVNIQKNQELIITANVNDNYFVKYLVEEAYKAKAKLVTVEWVSDEVERLTNQKASLKTLTEFPLWKEEKLKYQVENLPARLYLDSSDPDAMAGVDQDKMTEVRKINGPRIMKYREQMDNKYQWCIIGIPGEAWAHKVFPDLPVKKAVSKLWDAILEVTRINGDPIDNWNKHNAFLQNKTDKLNNLNLNHLVQISQLKRMKD